MRHLSTLFDLSVQEVQTILSIAAELKDGWNKGERPAILQGHVLTLLFEKPSLRTRNSFEAAMTQLGGGSIFLTSKDAGLHGRESLADIARVLTRYSDALAMRTFSQSLIEEFTLYARCPIINSLSDELHPCQALTDAFTLQELFGDIKGKEVVFVGDGNNVAASLAIITSMLEVSFTISTPKGYELDEEFVKDVKHRIPTANIQQVSNPYEAVKNADVIYTDVWASMGQEGESEKRKQVFAKYQINAELLAAAPIGCKFMHDLPAKRGQEVTDEIMDGPQSVVFQQAENRMHLAKGLLAWLMDPAYRTVETQQVEAQ